MKKLNFLLAISILLTFLYSCESDTSDLDFQPIETFEAKQVLFQGEVEQSNNNKSQLSLFGCSVTGPECALPNQSLTYTYSTSASNPIITWRINRGNISISRGQGTNTVVLNFASNFTGGEVTVLGAGLPNCSVTFEILRCGIIDCNNLLSIFDEYIDGTQSGVDLVYLQAGGNFPQGTTYTWKIRRQNGSMDSYHSSTDNPRQIEASINNRITQATVTAEYLNCSKTVTKTFRCAIPNADFNGNLFPECGGLGNGGGFN